VIGSAPRLATTALAAALVLAGAAAPVQAAGTLRLGLLADLSGAFGPSGNGERNGLQIYLEHHGDKLGGLPVEIVTEDTAGDPATALSKARKLIEADKVDVLLGPTSSAAGMAIKTYVVEHQVPTFIESTVDEVLDGKYIFRTTFNGNADAYAAGYLMGKAGFKKAIFLAPNYIAGQTSVANASKAFAATGGTVAQTLLPRIGAPDYGSYIAQLSSDADVAFVFLPGTDGVRFIKQYADFGKKIPLYGPSVTVDEQQLPAEGDAATGFVAISSYFSTIATPENKQLLAWWGESYSGQARPTWQTIGGYIAAEALDRAIATLHGELDDKDALIRSVEGLKLETPLGPFRFDTDHNPISPRYIAQIRNVEGKVQPVVIATIPDYLPNLSPPSLPPGLVLPR
jgi:branched-chain amino acid transport system substrate-binding protein